MDGGSLSDVSSSDSLARRAGWSLSHHLFSLTFRIFSLFFSILALYFGLGSVRSGVSLVQQNSRSPADSLCGSGCFFILSFSKFAGFSSAHWIGPERSFVSKQKQNSTLVFCRELGCDWPVLKLLKFSRSRTNAGAAVSDGAARPLGRPDRGTGWVLVLTRWTVPVR